MNVANKGIMVRIQSVDCFRVLAIFAVIAIHTTPFYYGKPAGHELDLVIIINQSARFAVPFFLIISGYFWSEKIQRNPDIPDVSIKSAQRVGVIFVLWSSIYLAIGAARSFVNGGQAGLLNDVAYAISLLVNKPITSLLQGESRTCGF